MKESIGARTILYPTPVFVVGTYDQEGRPNVMTAAWGGICCSEPPCVAVSLRRTRYSYGNIVQREAFTISIPSEKYVREADYFGMVSGEEVDKFAVTGLTPARSDVVDAPYVQEFPLVLECRLLRKVEIGVHVQFIGQIVDVKVEQSVARESGGPDIEKVRPLIFAPGDSAYYGIGARLGESFSVGVEAYG